MTVLEAIQKSTEFLAKKGVDSPRLQTELLLAHVLKLPRMKLYLNFERALAPAEVDSLREFIKRRSQREPLQHITGSTSFCGYEIAVSRHVLVPRPETELLAEFGLIVSTPPYIPSAEIATLQPEVRDFDPRLALDGGADGLEFYRLIAAQAGAFLKPDGKVMLEFGDGQAEAIRKIFEMEKWIVEAVKEDYSHRARILIARL